ncbi:MAG TPA: hypothetical protein VH092_22695 [Urbifossiella sp.]|jgi:hypothetical protein|nr:hypothetical protein [Urbifossiella sp.]
MILRKLRWLSAALLAAAAVFATPSVSLAETVITVQETGGPVQTFTAATLPTSFDTTNFSDIKITINSSSSSGPSTGHSISTTVNAAPASGFNTDIGLTVTVTDDGFLNSNPGGAGIFEGNVSNTSAFADTTATGTTLLSSPATTLGPTTASSGTSSLFSPSSVSGIPGSYSIEQVLTLRVTALSNPNATFTAGISSQVLSNPLPVPAPPAILLALAAVPVLGLRRVMRRKA